ncbi:hypothetical protein CR513_62994, partial [Mucuna pruriens]
MKGMPLFLLKNSLGETKMKKTCCYSEGSTSTLNKQNNTIGNSNQHCQVHLSSKVSSLTMHDVMMQFELESKLSDDFSGMRGRMSCVNDSNILRSTRKALNQYPRLSLDGRDAMCRSTLGNINERRSVCCDRELRRGLLEENNDLLGSRFDKGMSMSGESVVWCKPGVVARLMGLEAIPLPIHSRILVYIDVIVMLVCFPWFA